MIVTMMLVMMIIPTSQGYSLGSGVTGVEKCDPTLIPKLPPRMKHICLSLLKTIQDYDDAINAADEAQGEQTIFICYWDLAAHFHWALLTVAPYIVYVQNGA